jgi:hypothetical protein
MPSQGPNTPGTAVDGGGSYAWLFPANAKVEDGTITSASIGPGNDSNVLTVSNFGFTASGVINGIAVSIKRQASAVNDVKDKIVSLTLSGSANEGDNSVAWPLALGFANYGGAADLWGVTPSAADINGADFGVNVQAHNGNGGSPRSGSIDVVIVTVYYTPVAAVIPVMATVVRQIDERGWLEE